MQFAFAVNMVSARKQKVTRIRRLFLGGRSWAAGPGCLASVLALASIGTVSQPLLACVRMADGWNLWVSTPSVPANGVLVLSQRCDAACDVESPVRSVVVKDRVSGAIVAGNVVELLPPSALPGPLFWRPDTALEPGHIYDVARAEGQGDRPSLSFSAVEALTGTPAGLSLALTAQIEDQAEGSEFCCLLAVPGICSRKPCSSVLNSRGARLTASWGPQGSGWVTQTLFRVSWSNASGDAWSATGYQWGLNASARVEKAETEYCASVELLSLIDGKVYPLARNCVAHAPLGPLGVLRIPEASFAEALAGCELPSASLSKSYCDTLAEACAAGLSPACHAEGCETAGAGGTSGLGGAPPAAGGAPSRGGGPGITGGADVGGSGRAALGGQSGTLEENSSLSSPGQSAGAEGCSCRLASESNSSRGGGLGLMLFASGACVAVARRRAFLRDKKHG